MTALSRDDVTLQHAYSILQRWQELLGVGPAPAVWQEIDRLFRQQKVQPWTAAQFFLHQAAGMASNKDPSGKETYREAEEQGATLKVWY